MKIGMNIRGCHTFATKIYWLIQFVGYLRTLGLKFQKARTKIEVVLTLPCWLSQFRWDSQQGRPRTTSILVRAFWNFKFKVLKQPRNCNLHATWIPNLVKPLMYILSYSTMLIVAAYQSFFSFLLFRFHLQPCVFVHRTGTKQYPLCPFKCFSSKNYENSYLSLSENLKKT